MPPDTAVPPPPAKQPGTRSFWKPALVVLALSLLAVNLTHLLTDREQFSPAAGGPGPAFGRFVTAEQPAPLPEIVFTDSSGRRIALRDFAGQVVLLNLWATWCGPCVKEMPALDRLQTALGSPGFRVVALSVDRGGAEVVVPFFEKLGLRALTPYLDTEGKALKSLGTHGLPTTLLIDREGREVGRMVGGADWDQPEVQQMIRRLLSPAPRPAPLTSGT